MRQGFRAMPVRILAGYFLCVIIRVMETIIRKLEKDQLDTEEGKAVIAEAGALLAAGDLAAFPTETVYGLGADAFSAEGAGKIYAAKGRPSDNPLIVHIAQVSALKALAEEIPKEAYLLADAFWPGPLTMILKKKAAVPYETTGGLDTVAVRMPAHETARALIAAAGGFVAAPSANTSGRPSPTRAEHVYEDLNGKIPLIIDGGEVGIGLESTIVDLSGDVPMILRPGCITQEMLKEVIGDVSLDPGLLSENDERRPKAPGMRYRHYAPRAQMILVSGTEEAAVRKILSLAAASAAEGKRTGILAGRETAERYAASDPLFLVRTIGSRTEEEEIARHLYAVLREFDELRVDVIYSECFDTPHLGEAIMNRMLKAAGHRVICAEEKI